MTMITSDQLTAAGETSAETCEGALYLAIATAALGTSDPASLLALAEAFDRIAKSDDAPETPDKGIHTTDSATMLESRFWDEGNRVCGFTPRGLPKSKYRYKEGPESVV